MKPVELFHIGPQKAATTWVYECLKEHPEVACPSKDSIHYFDMFYTKGRTWYGSFFEGAREEQKLFDPTPSYIRSPWAPERIAKENPNAKIILCMRNPIERAFSHYWHDKKKGSYNFDFSEVLKNYDLFSSWVEPGFYAEHLKKYFEYFSTDQILCQLFDNLKENPEAFLKQLLVFIGVDARFTPSVIHTQVNEAGVQNSFINRSRQKTGGLLRKVGLESILKSFISKSAILSGKGEYLRGIPQSVYDPLREICEPEIVRIEKLLGINLDRWRRNPNRGTESPDIPCLP